MTVGIWILGDQLTLQHPALNPESVDRGQARILLVESLEHVQQRPYHRQKLVLVWSAMRHFAADLRSQGWTVDYLEQAPSFATAVSEWCQQQQITELQVMEPADRSFHAIASGLALPAKLHWLPNHQFLWSTTEFTAWAKPYRQLRLENFYREGRKRWQVLLTEDQEPVGGQWNFDPENRKPPKTGLQPPPAAQFSPDSITQTVIETVRSLELPLYGKLESFHWPVTRSQALEALDQFLTVKLKTFGPYQDAMVSGQATMWHSLIAPALNLGLLHPLEVIRRAEQAFYDNQAPIASVEGFIRQILGWREYMHGLHHYFPETYPQSNWFEHNRPLPEFFWTGKTDLHCLQQCFQQLEAIGYSHHIQRLMILANFALIAGLNPWQVKEWFQATHLDAYDWVMETNVLGMGLFADGGKLASKPYAASANYINRMSNYCQSCRYDPKQRLGDRACPFNALYWDFLDRHEQKLQAQGRMALILKQLQKMPDSDRAAIRDQAAHWQASWS
ncbi:cryptochrome/photolyase family protein [Synechococcus elongatus IITB7]|uniref:cryptochrome/photolyase family protein n=1 Tax=Synechococcus elongatus TaxID=32046 RepID=UPI0030CB262E